MLPGTDPGETTAAPAVTTGPEPDSNADSNKPSTDATAAGPAVRFSSAVDVAPAPPAASESNEPDDHDDGSNTFSDVAADQLKAFTKSLHGKPLQTKRMNTSYQFEAFSLPASRVSFCSCVNFIACI
jgi:hypothetical protein